MKTLRLLLILLVSVPFVARAQAQGVHGKVVPNIATAINAVGLTGADTSNVALCTITAAGGAWADGAIVKLCVVLEWAPGDTTDGNAYLRSDFAANGSPFTFDSSQFSTTLSIVPYEFEFIRVGTAIYFSPASAHLIASNAFAQSLVRSGTLAAAQLDYFAVDNANHALAYTNGHKYTGIDFTQPITIKWDAQWQALPNDHRDVLKIISGGTQYIALQ